MAPRTRMSPEDRRTQLLDLGARLFAEHPYDDVLIEQVAEAAGVSRGLLYHYFPTKRDFFLELLRREAGELLERTAPDPGLPLRDQLLQGVDRYLDHYETHRHGVVAVNRGLASSDPQVQEVVRDGVAQQGDLIAAVLSPGGTPHPLLTIAVRGWLDFLRSVSFDWLQQHDERPDAVHRDQIRDLAAATLVGALLALPDDVRPAAVAELHG